MGSVPINNDTELREHVSSVIDRFRWITEQSSIAPAQGESAGDSRYYAYCAEMPGAGAFGETREAARQAAHARVSEYLSARVLKGGDLPTAIADDTNVVQIFLSLPAEDRATLDKASARSGMPLPELVQRLAVSGAKFSLEMPESAPDAWLKAFEKNIHATGAKVDRLK